MTRNSSHSPFYNPRNGHTTNRRWHTSKLSASAAIGFILVPLITIFDPELAFLIETKCNEEPTDLSEDLDERLRKALSTGRWFFGAYFNSEVTEHGVMPVLGRGEVQILSVPDPYNSEKHFLMYQCCFRSPLEPSLDIAVATRKVLIADFEKRRHELEVNRGLIFITGGSGNYFIYFDGGTFLNVVIPEIYSEKLLIHLGEILGYRVDTLVT
ncbi:hypothetical protein F4819DRAFT_439798 [Hypoxylon fuscum]|nr:hypothetical protein F4819DRAFT_439798 [Hypoxylon fuscum]